MYNKLCYVVPPFLKREGSIFANQAKVSRKRLPFPASEITVRLPLCIYMICREILSPMPEPTGLVVKNGMKMTYTIVSESEANLKEGKISVNTPIAQGLLGKKVGDVAEITVPQGKIALEVVNISI